LARSVRILFDVGAAAGLSDTQLLDRFTAHAGVGPNAEAAFNVLVERHGPMVLRVCRYVLADRHDAEDAFQASFLVLARRARSIRERDSVASWLHGVALRVASCARAADLRRRAHERRRAEAASLADLPIEPDDLGQALHEEIDRLPERYRSVVVLCYLEGMTHDAAAALLGWPVGTVRTRLSWARDRLRRRLMRRGLAPGRAAVAETALSAGAFAEAPQISSSLSDATVRAALHVISGRAITGGVVAARVARLAEWGVSRIMLRARLTIAAVALLGAGGLGLLASRPAAQAHAQAPAPRWTAQAPAVKLSNGTSIEVVGVSPCPSGPSTWIKPDGSPLADAPEKTLRNPVNASTLPFALEDSGGDVREVVIRVSGLTDDGTIVWYPRNCVSHGLDQPPPAGQGTKSAPTLLRAVARFPKGLASTTIFVRVTSGPWTTENAWAQPSGGAGAANDRPFLRGEARAIEGGGTALAVAHTLNDRDTRIVARDSSNKLRLPATVTVTGAGGLRLTETKFDLPPDQIRTFKLQSRAFEEVLYFP
jgi:RNA polymerase sigma factor (sigma-70 family)